MIRLTTVACILFVFLYSGNSYPQDSKTVNLDSDEINSLTSKLSKKILLSQEQNNQVITLLKDYSKQQDAIRGTNASTVTDDNKMKQLVTSTDEKIINLLDEKQKMKFKIIRDDWWKEIKTEGND
jgi:septal ring factor EnvC (AmiA/AmiB activator)